jgi:tetratricopeptide (TPR) repeat protein
MQLNLFTDAPRHYFLALERLAQFDFEGCRAALDDHQRYFPRGPDVRPVEEAARWLEERVPAPTSGPAKFGRGALELCRALLEDRASPAFARVGPDTVTRSARTLAVRALAAMAETGVDPADPLSSELPWGVFRLWAGDFVGARSALERFLRSRGPKPAAWLALGDALWQVGRRDEALRAYRDGYGLDPSGGGWAPVCPRPVELKQSFENDPSYSGDWWAVGAYLDGNFPSYRGAGADDVFGRWKGFGQIRRAALEDRQSAPTLFFSGLFLSENGRWLRAPDLALVRQTLRELHPEAYETHLEQLED